MTKIGMLACIAATALLSGCAAMVPHDAQYTNSQTYPESRSAVWAKVLSMSAHNAMIVSPDNANGIIEARREIVNPHSDPVFDWADCGWSGVFGRPLSQRIDVHYLIQDDSRGTKVIINTEFRELRLNVVNQKAAWVSCTSTGILEEELLDALWGV
jgi:hypothetical protein